MPHSESCRRQININWMWGCQMACVTSIRIMWRCCACIVLLFVLTACDPWSISQIYVNPQPAGGFATVFPVSLVAPANPDIATQGVEVNVTFKRNQDFTANLQFWLQV